MGKVIIGVTMSLDGFAEDADGSVGALYPDLASLDASEVQQASIRNTGAVVMAWKEYAMAEDPDWFAGNYEYHAPIFIVTDRAPEKHPKETRKLTFTYVTDGLASAIGQAKAAAGNRDVTIIGSAAVTREVLTAGVADELHLDIVPLVLVKGFRPFEGLRDAPFRLVRLESAELPAGRVHIVFRIDIMAEAG
jgi:dihydrofolate reductase